MNIENLSDDVLGAYLDGELSPEARAALERQLLGEPGARVRLDRLRESDERMRRAFALPDEPRADPLLRLLRGEAAPMPAVRADRPRRRHAKIAGLALAAAIGGFALGVGLQLRAPSSGADAGVAMGATLRDALDRNPSGVRRDGVMVVLSFRDHDGAPCRQFEVTTAGAASEGVACRRDAQWRMSVWQERAAAEGGYRTAGGEDSPVELAVDALDATGPLSPQDEAGLIAKGW